MRQVPELSASEKYDTLLTLPDGRALIEHTHIYDSSSHPAIAL